jgi:hypothetical protein
MTQTVNWLEDDECKAFFQLYQLKQGEDEGFAQRFTNAVLDEYEDGEGNSPPNAIHLMKDAEKYGITDMSALCASWVEMINEGDADRASHSVSDPSTPSVAVEEPAGRVDLDDLDDLDDLEDEPEPVEEELPEELQEELEELEAEEEDMEQRLEEGGVAEAAMSEQIDSPPEAPADPFDLLAETMRQASMQNSPKGLTEKDVERIAKRVFKELIKKAQIKI